MGHDHDMWNSHYIPLHRVIAKSLLSTSFYTASPSASEIADLGDPGSNIGNWFKTLVLGITLHSGDVKEFKNNKCKKF